MRHSSPTNDDAPPGPSFDWPPDYFDSQEELIEAARQYFATDFPNPERKGCPIPGEYQSLISAGRPLNAELRSHLFGCSECFNEYRAAALEHRHQTAFKRFSWAGAWLTQINIALRASRVPLAITGIALLLLATGLFVWRHRQTESPQLVQIRPQPVSAPVGNARGVKPEVADTVPAEDSKPAAAKSMSKPKTSKEADNELLAINIDLNDYHSLGEQRRAGSQNEEERPITLSSARLWLTLQLREKSKAGNFRISIIDSSGHRAAATKARSRDGRTAQAMIDLRRVATTILTLRIERANQPDIAPEDYKVEIVQP
jgi:hypothetical protein